MTSKKEMSRRGFITTTTAATAGLLLSNPGGRLMASMPGFSKKRLAIVGTGIRALKFWGGYVAENFGDITEFVALCDINPGRVEFTKTRLGLNCETFTNFDEMIAKVPIDLLFVTTVDATHNEFIVKALNNNINVATEKPMTTDEVKCQEIITAEKNSKAKLIMGFNYRYGHLFTKLKEILMEEKVGEITSVDFHWYLNTFHGADYFRRWHGERKHSGTLLLHKASHHFDLLNWWIGSDPVEVHAYGALEYYGKSNSFRGKRCSTCPNKEKCQFYWDINTNKDAVKLYLENEKYDGYIRDNCLYRENIDIFDKMAVQIKYANNVQVSYSLTTYSPYEGFRIAFNGKKGRMETWEGIPQLEKVQEDQSKVYEKEMTQTTHAEAELKYHEIVTQLNFEKHERIEFPFLRSGHWGGDNIMMEEILRAPKMDRNLHHAANGRDGSMAVLIGIAARKSIDEGRPIKIADLTELKPKVDKWG